MSVMSVLLMVVGVFGLEVLTEKVAVSERFVRMGSVLHKHVQMEHLMGNVLKVIHQNTVTHQLER
jgi:arginine exporter protein ArgO